MASCCWRKRIWIYLRSMVVGGIATIIDLVVLSLLVSGLGVAPALASPPALSLGIAAQFVGNKWFAFEDHSPRWIRQGTRFLLVEALGFVLNLSLYHLAVTYTDLPYLPIRLATTALIYFGFCLPLWSLIFRPRPEDDPEPRSEQLA